MLPLSNKDNRLFPRSYTTEEQAISNLKNLLLTREGERYFHPTFGTRIIDTLFENNVLLIREGLRDNITAAIAYWLPYINVSKLDVFIPQSKEELDSLNVGKDQAEHVIKIDLFFSVGNSGANRSITLGIGATGQVSILPTVDNFNLAI